MSILQQILWFLWPVQKEEQSRTLMMFFVLFLVSFIYNILRALKLTILLAEPGLSGQAISYLKIFAITPAAILFTGIATQMQTRMGQSRTFIATILFFGLLFAVLVFGVLPYKEYYRLSLPGNHELISLINCWYITLFYTAAEMWSSIVLNMLCWGIIIEITEFADSKRLYSIFSLSANLATFAAGWWASTNLEGQFQYLTGVEMSTWEHSLLFQMVVIWVIQLLTIVIFQRTIREQSKSQQEALSTKLEIGLIDSIKMAFSHPVIRGVALIMISYNIIYHIVDVIHNEYARELFATTPRLMNKYFNIVNQYLGIFAVLFSWVLAGSFVRRFGLVASLLFTPCLWMSMSLLDVLSSSGYLGTFSVEWEHVLLPISLLSLSVLLSIGRAAKFTIFDAAKEMSLLSLSRQDKRLGKAVIDGLTSRFGKTGGACLVILITGQAGNILASLVPLKGAIFLAYFLWFYGIATLARCLPKTLLEH